MHLNIKGCDGSPGSTGETPLCSIPFPAFQKRISGTENGSKRGIDAGFIRFARPPSGAQIGHIFRGVHFIRPPQQIVDGASQQISNRYEPPRLFRPDTAGKPVIQGNRAGLHLREPLHVPRSDVICGSAKIILYAHALGLPQSSYPLVAVPDDFFQRSFPRLFLGIFLLAFFLGFFRSTCRVSDAKVQ